jgi:hypothetical protein
MKHAAWLLALVPMTATAEGGTRERVEAVVEAEARRADEQARARRSDRLANPLELALLEELERMMGLALLVVPISTDPVLEAQRRLEALRVEVYSRLLPLQPGGYAGLAEALGAEARAFEHRLIRIELPTQLSKRGLDRLSTELERTPNLRAMLFVHGGDGDGASRVEAIREHLEDSVALREKRLVLERSGVPGLGATLYLVRLKPTS